MLSAEDAMHFSSVSCCSSPDHFAGFFRYFRQPNERIAMFHRQTLPWGTAVEESSTLKSGGWKNPKVVINIREGNPFPRPINYKIINATTTSRCTRTHRQTRARGLDTILHGGERLARVQCPHVERAAGGDALRAGSADASVVAARRGNAHI